MLEDPQLRGEKTFMTITRRSGVRAAAHMVPAHPNRQLGEHVLPELGLDALPGGVEAVGQPAKGVVHLQRHPQRGKHVVRLRA